MQLAMIITPPSPNLDAALAILADGQPRRASEIFAEGCSAGSSTRTAKAATGFTKTSAFTSSGRWSLGRSQREPSVALGL